MMAKYTFSGHETFQCKSLWLKKGYDFVKRGGDFNGEDAVVELGVGKNMVTSIRFWLKSFGIINSDGAITEIGDYIFNDNGCDPYMEDPNTLWLLHYQLVNTEYATIYYQTFAAFQKERKEFSKENLQKFFQRKFNDKAFGNIPYNDNTIKKDIDTLLKNYVAPDSAIFDDFSSTLQQLGLIRKIDRDNYEFANFSKAPFHPFVFLFAINHIMNGEQVLEYEKLVDLSLQFCITQNAMHDLFRQLHKMNNNITFDNAAGEQLFAIKEHISWREILDTYYKA